MTLKISKYVVATQSVFDERDYRRKRVVFATRTATVRVVDEAIWETLLEGKFDDLPEQVIRDLLAIQLLVDTEEDELTTIISGNRRSIAEDLVYYQVVQPTAACQLGCDYCGQSHSGQRLSENHQEKFVDYVQAGLANSVKPYRTLAICWFGGEPLLALPVMRSLTPKLKAIATEYGCSYQAKLVTNGARLTSELATELVAQMNVNQIEITLDGTEDFHDTRRHRKNGKPTFSTIFANLVSVAERDDLAVALSVRCNVDKRNFEGVSPLIKTLAGAGLQKRITFYTASVYSWGNDADRLSLSPAEYASLQIRWFIEQLKLGFDVGIVPQLRPIVCMAVNPDSRLVDAFGNVFNCTEVSYVPAYGTPNRFAVGHLDVKSDADRWNVLGDFNAGAAPVY